jgi:hypothetical protein
MEKRSLSAYEVELDNSIHPERPRVFFYDNFDKYEQQREDDIAH